MLLKSLSHTWNDFNTTKGCYRNAPVFIGNFFSFEVHSIESCSCERCHRMFQKNILVYKSTNCLTNFPLKTWKVSMLCFPCYLQMLETNLAKSYEKCWLNEFQIYVSWFFYWKMMRIKINLNSVEQERSCHAACCIDFTFKKAWRETTLTTKITTHSKYPCRRNLNNKEIS